MPRRVHSQLFVIHPPDDLLATRPELGRAAADLARAYRHMGEDFARLHQRDASQEAPDKIEIVSDKWLQAIGAALWGALAAADPTLPGQLATARDAAAPFLLPLVIESGVPAVQALPWEALYTAGPPGAPGPGFLGLNPDFTLSRRLGEAAPAQPPDRGPLQVVMFTCLPDDVDPERGRLDVEEQQAQALAAWGEAVAKGMAWLEVPDDGRFSTFEALVRGDLIRGFRPHLVFLFAHGKHVNEPGQTAPPYTIIQFEDDHGHSDFVRDETLAAVFRGSGVRAVVMAACESGKGDSAELAAGLAGAISRAGVPHVLGMRESILATAGIAYNTAFARAVAGEERADVAAQLARAAITRPLAEALGPNGGELVELSLGQWPLPALLSRDPAAPLIDWNFTPAPPRPAAPSGDNLDGIPLPQRLIGRRTELRDWQAPLLRGTRPVLLISGVGGRGKTALAGRIARVWLAEGRPAAGWSARDGMDGWDVFYLRLIRQAGETAFAQATAGVDDEAERAAILLQLLLRRHDGQLLLFLDNLETVQDGHTLHWRDGRLAAFIAAARALAEAGTGLRLLLTTRWQPPGWPDAAHLRLPKVTFGDFLQLALARRAPAAFWQANRPRRIYDTLDGNARGLEFVAAALADLAPAAEEAFLERLREADEKVRVDVALATLIDNLDVDARALLARLPAYDVAMPLDGLRAMALDQPNLETALDRLLAVGLAERSDNHAWQTTAYQIAAPVAAWLAEQPEQLEPAWLRAAAGYQQWLFDNERPTLEQAVVLHRALTRAGEQAAADRLALSRIIQALEHIGLYRVLLAEWLPALRQSTEDRAQAIALNLTGVCHRNLGNYESALDYLEKALALTRTMGDQQGEGATLNNIALAHRALGDYSTALITFQQSLTISQSIGDRAGQGRTLNNIGRISYDRGDYEAALDYFQQSLTISQAVGDRQGEGSALNNISQIYDARGDYDNSLTYLEQSLAIRRAIGDRTGEGATLNNIANIYHARGSYDTALATLQQSLTIRRAIGDLAGEGDTLHNISRIYLVWGDYDTTREYLEQALAIARTIGDRAGEGATLHEVAQLYLSQGKHDEALAYLENSLTISRALGDRAGEGISLNSVGHIYFTNGDYDAGLRYLEQALTINRLIGNRAGEGATLNSISQVYLARGDYETALGYQQQSVGIYKDIGNANGLCNALFNVGHIFAQKQQVQQALVVWVAAYQIASRIGWAEALQNLEQLAGQIGLPGGLAGWAVLAKDVQVEA